MFAIFSDRFTTHHAILSTRPGSAGRKSPEEHHRGATFWGLCSTKRRRILRCLVPHDHDSGLRRPVTFRFTGTLLLAVECVSD